MATSKVLSISLFVLLGLSMCSATRKLYGDENGFQPQGDHLPVPQITGSGGLPGVTGEGGLGDGRLPGEYIKPDGDGFYPEGDSLPSPNEEGSGGLPGGIGSGALPGGLRGVPGEGDLGDEKVLGGLPGGVNSGGDGYQPGGAEVPGGGGDGGLSGTEDGVLPDERGYV
ncbi:hypothetical protein MtrunA17_Chr8g0366631 [Medicago truncatula]|uniref:Transmembrane protein n=1 Tax=Medicago truncatula TaxID=3880 RepID=G7LHP4_MEDTR|nr:pro-resilin [Medicago truncatula]AET03278.1 hypothetical protein MTR_8g066920 [Medicago truncatula]RHN41489.1 hypothetical protein MtrunA17_Chr8g0366631 [Medicago truncatula]